MQLIGTEHVSDIPYVYITGKDTIEIKIRTPKDQVKKVTLIYNDPYDYVDEEWRRLEMDLEHMHSDDMYDWWIKEVTVEARRFLYSFKIENNLGELSYYTESGLDDDLDVAYQFNLPFSHEEEIFTYPKWIDKTVWYQIFPDRFCSSTKEKQAKWHTGSVTNEEMYGGNIQGIISKLDYIQDLGANAIYFTPIFKADSSHKYDTTDYFMIDPQFGTESDFKELIEEAHKRSIRIMLDGVFNHTSKNHPFFKDVVNKKEDSAYKDWYYINDFNHLEDDLSLSDDQFKETNPYNTFGYTPNMPKLNLANKEARSHILNAVKHWTEMGIDGWRLDVANEVCHDFWKEFKKLVTSINPDIYIVGEIWHDSISWLRGDEFQAVMNYKYSSAIIDYFFKKSISLEKFENRVVRTLMQYTPAINKAAFNLFDSHDTMRVKDMCEHDLNRLKLGTIFLFTQSGTPCIYYGTEIGMDGKGDPDNRKLMIWDEIKWDKDLLNFYKELIDLRKTHPTLTNAGEFKFLDNDQLCEYTRFSAGEKYIIALNNSEKEVPYTTQGNILLSNNLQTKSIGPFGYVIYKQDN